MVFERWDGKVRTTVGESVLWHLTKELVQYFNNASYFKQNDNSNKSVRKWALAAHKNQVRIWLVMPAKVKETSLYKMENFLQLQHVFYKGNTGLALIFVHFLLLFFLFKTDHFFILLHSHNGLYSLFWISLEIFGKLWLLKGGKSKIYT